MKRLSRALVLFLVAAGFLACNKNVHEGRELDWSGNSSPASSAPMKPPQPMPATSGPAIQGVIRVVPELAGKVTGTETLFLMAKDANGALVAVQRIRPVSFPMEFQLSQANVMMPGTKFEGTMTVSARLDHDGDAGSTEDSDLEGGTENPVSVGGPPVEILLGPLLIEK